MAWIVNAGTEIISDTISASIKKLNPFNLRYVKQKENAFYINLKSAMRSKDTPQNGFLKNLGVENRLDYMQSKNTYNKVLVTKTNFLYD